MNRLATIAETNTRAALLLAGQTALIVALLTYGILFDSMIAVFATIVLCVVTMITDGVIARRIDRRNNPGDSPL